MGVSLFRIAEQARVILEKRVTIQVLIPSVIDAYGFVAKKIWFENTQFDEAEVDGSFINIFTKIVPIKDCDRNLYYIIVPSTYLILPHQAGVVWLGLMQDTESWVRVDNWSVYAGLKASVFGGLEPYQIEGNKILFPTMTEDNTGPMLLKLAIAYDKIDPYESLNIGPNIVNDIIGIVTAPYMNKQNPIEKIREIIN